MATGTGGAVHPGGVEYCKPSVGARCTTAAGEWPAEVISGRADLPAALQRYGLPVFGQAGLRAAQASYSWAELRDALRERRPLIT